MIITLSDVPQTAISDHDLAALAQWAHKQNHLAYADRDPQAAKSFAMIREAADNLLRARALKKEKA